MILFTALLIPILTAFVLYVFFKHKTALWEFLLPLGVSIILITIFKLGSEGYRTSDTEYWSGYVTKTEYFEDWNERVSCSHPKYCTRTVSNGNGGTKSESYQCGYQHLYDVDYHPEYWSITDNNGIKKTINKKTYNRLVKSFGNERFVDLSRSYHTDDGDKYLSKWGGNDKTLECVVTKHSYENRVQASDDIFNFQEVDTFDINHYGLYDYPEVKGYQQTNLLGKHSDWENMNRKLEILNARLGRKKQLKVFVLLFDNKLKEAAFKQEAYWKGGNKNEFVICVGLNEGGNVTWCYPFSWTEQMITKVNVRTFVEEQKTFNLGATIDYTYKTLDENFVRKPFADFSYLTVNPTGWQIFWAFLVTFLVNIGLSIFIIRNDID